MRFVLRIIPVSPRSWMVAGWNKVVPSTEALTQCGNCPPRLTEEYFSRTAPGLSDISPGSLNSRPQSMTQRYWSTKDCHLKSFVLLPYANECKGSIITEGRFVLAQSPGTQTAQCSQWKASTLLINQVCRKRRVTQLQALAVWRPDFKDAGVLFPNTAQETLQTGSVRRRDASKCFSKTGQERPCYSGTTRAWMDKRTLALFPCKCQKVCSQSTRASLCI